MLQGCLELVELQVQMEPKAIQVAQDLQVLPALPEQVGCLDQLDHPEQQGHQDRWDPRALLDFKGTPAPLDCPGYRDLLELAERLVHLVPQDLLGHLVLLVHLDPKVQSVP